MATSFRIFSVRNMHTVLPYSTKWSFHSRILICSLDCKWKHAACTKKVVRTFHNPSQRGAPSADRGTNRDRQFARQILLNLHQAQRM